MLRFIAALAVLFGASQALAKDPESKIVKVADGMVGRCETVADVGAWAYLPFHVSAESANDEVRVRLNLFNMTCVRSTSNPESVVWTSRNSLESVNRPGRPLVHIRELYAALIDVNAGKRQELAAPNGSVHYYDWQWPMPNLDKQLARLKDGQSLRKRLLFAMRAVMQPDDGSAKYVAHGGSYHIDLVWTRQNGNVQLAAKFVTN